MIWPALARMMRRTLAEPDPLQQPPAHGPHALGDSAPEGWLTAETWPVSPAAWASPWTVAARLLDLVAASAWNNHSADQQQTLAGHARGHMQHLRRARGDDASDTSGLIDAAQVICSIRFDGWAESTGWTAQGFRRLEASLCAQLGPGSAPVHDPDHLAQTLWAVALAHATSMAADRPFPASVLRTWRSGVQTVVDLAGTSGQTPDLDGTRAPVLPLGPTPLPVTLAHLAHHWTDLDCPRPEHADPAFTRLTGEQPIGREWPEVAHWHARAWRDAGIAVAHARNHHLIGRSNDQAVWWTVDGHRVLHGSATNLIRTDTPLDVARVDGRVVHMKLGDRSIGMEGARLTVNDSDPTGPIRWSFPPGTSLTPTDKGFIADTQHGELNIVAGDGWVIDESSILHRGQHQHLRIRFELR